MDDNTVKDGSIAKLQLLLGIHRQFTEDDWWHIVGHYTSNSISTTTNRLSGIYVPNAIVACQPELPSIESNLTTWHRRGLALEYCLKHPPDFSLFAK